TAFGWQVSGVDSGAAALTAIDQAVADDRPFQLVLIDQRMPDMGGLQTVQQLVKRWASQELRPKIILLTTHEQDELLQSKSVVGVQALLTKPINCSLLFDTVMDLFGQDVAKNFHAGRDEIDVQQLIRHIGGARVLLVEDNDINRQVAQEILERVGLVVEWAGNGVEALHKVATQTYDIVLMDVQMPVMDGYEATRQLRRQPQYAQLIVVAMTANAMSGDREQCLAAGMNDHVGKPIHRRELFDTLTKWIAPRNQLLPTPAAAFVTPSTGGLPETLAGIDLTVALERLSGNQDLLRSLLLEFGRDFADAGRKIGFLLEGKRQNDLKDAERLAHSVKGMAGNIAAQDLFHAALTLEKAIRDGQKQQWPLLLQSFQHDLDQACATIATLPSQPTENIQTEATAIDWQQVRPLLTELERHLTDCNVLAQENIEALKPLLRGTALEQPLSQLDSCLAAFDFDAALVHWNAMNQHS
ncbi:MAG: response regulator, partial [Magnetococcales bacterium]|nr:response regulator [Magnetococcales bacterium]